MLFELKNFLCRNVVGMLQILYRITQVKQFFYGKSACHYSSVYIDYSYRNSIDCLTVFERNDNLPVLNFVSAKN